MCKNYLNSSAAEQQTNSFVWLFCQISHPKYPNYQYYVRLILTRVQTLDGFHVWSPAAC